MLEFRPADESQNTASYIAYDKGLECGNCTFDFVGFDMRFTLIDCSDDSVKEGLMRSAMNYCANRNAYICMIKPDMLCPAAMRLGFTADRLAVEIPEALASTCCSCGK